jgi:hypothetical protein
MLKGYSNSTNSIQIIYQFFLVLRRENRFSAYHKVGTFLHQKEKKARIMQEEDKVFCPHMRVSHLNTEEEISHVEGI